MDGAGASRDLVTHITTLNDQPGRGVRYWVGWDLPPRIARICSPYYLDARYATKRGSSRQSYKVHLADAG